MVGLIDCDNFFCSCERMFRPDLAGRPVVVLSNNDGCVVARSSEAKALGIKECMPYYRLREQYPGDGIVAFSSNYTLYGDMSARIMAVLRESAPDVAQYSIDEAFLDLRGMEGWDLKRWGEELCRKVLRCTGMPVSLGIAPTRTLAKMASRFAKQYPGYNKCCVIGTEEQREKALKLFPVGDIWGIGRHTAHQLEYLGVRTAYDLTQRSRSWIRSKFHVAGERIWTELRGEGATGLDSVDSVGKKTIVTSRSFPDMLTDIGEIRSHIANYAARCAAKLRRQHSVCSLATVFIQSNHFRSDLEQYDKSASYSFPTATDTTPEIVEAAVMALGRIFRKDIYYKRAGVMVSGISPAATLQPDLFTFDPEKRKRRHDISETVDRINRRIGADTVILGSQQYLARDKDGKSVSFADAIRHTLRSPDYSTRLGAFTVH